MPDLVFGQMPIWAFSDTVFRIWPDADFGIPRCRYQTVVITFGCLAKMPKCGIPEMPKYGI
jgi:hypothetical protein